MQFIINYRHLSLHLDFSSLVFAQGWWLLAEVSTFVEGQKVNISDLAGPDDLCHSRSSCFYSEEAARDKGQTGAVVELQYPKGEAGELNLRS